MRNGDEENITSTDAFIIYPNPANQSAAINWLSAADGDKEILLFDLEGRKMLEQKTSSEEKQTLINLSNLPEGMYLLKVAGENYNATKKISVIH